MYYSSINITTLVEVVVVFLVVGVVAVELLAIGLATVMQH